MSLFRQVSSVREDPCRDSESEQADYDRRSVQKLNRVIESQRGEINRALAGDEQIQRDQQLLHEQLFEQNRG